MRVLLLYSHSPSAEGRRYLSRYSSGRRGPGSGDRQKRCRAGGRPPGAVLISHSQACSLCAIFRNPPCQREVENVQFKHVNPALSDTVFGADHLQRTLVEFAQRPRNRSSGTPVAPWLTLLFDQAACGSIVHRESGRVDEPKSGGLEAQYDNITLRFPP